MLFNYLINKVILNINVLYINIKLEVYKIKYNVNS